MCVCVCVYTFHFILQCLLCMFHVLTVVIPVTWGANLSPFDEIRHFHLEIGHSRESCSSVKEKKNMGGLPSSLYL